MRRLTTEEFVTKARGVHNNKYDYSKVVYKGWDKKVEIICPTHGSFWQRPNNHYTNGCGKCWEDRRCLVKRRDTNWFVDQAREIFSDEYDYSLSEYITSKDKVEIICKHHGKFEKYPFDHIRGSGCPKCSGYNLDKEDWIGRFKEVHGDKYEYKNFDFTLSTNKSRIDCKTHGPFWQTPSKHVNGRGCPDCALGSRSEKWDPISSWGITGYYGTDKPSNFYILNVEDEFIKIGLSVNIRHRINKLRSDSGYNANVLFSFHGQADILYDIEQTILRNESLMKYKTEKRFNRSRECFHKSEFDNICRIFEELYAKTN